jgi:hypothetical protein
MSKNLPDLFVAGFGIKSILNPLSLLGLAAGMAAFFSKDISNAYCAYPGNSPGLPLFAFIILIFCFMKARGDLPDAAGFSLSAGISLSRFAVANRDFYLLAS